MLVIRRAAPQISLARSSGEYVNHGSIEGCGSASLPFRFDRDLQLGSGSPATISAMLETSQLAHLHVVVAGITLDTWLI